MSEIQAGRETDARVAKALGYEVRTATDEDFLLLCLLNDCSDRALVSSGESYIWLEQEDHQPERRIPRYSEDIAAAWTVAERLVAMGLTPTVYHVNQHFGDPTSFWACRVERYEGLVVDTLTLCVGISAPLAICRAALKCFEQEETK
jgi:hypothetical protein